MRIKLNGEERTVENGETVDQLLASLELDRQKIAVELNLAIVPRSCYALTVLSDGDAVEIVRFIGGG